MYKALLVCNSVFPEDPAGLPALKGPRADGLMLWRTLTDSAVGMFSDENVTVMYERTSREILEAIEEFFGSATSKDMLLFYYSGHGMRASGKLYLCGRDASSHKLRATGVPSAAIKDIIEQSKALSATVLLDCCHSGAFKGAEQVVDDFKGSGTYVLAASRASELAEDADAVGSTSPFTGALVEALMGRAEDVNNDGRLDLDEIYRAMYGSLRKLGYPEPRKHFDGSGSITIAKVSSVSAAKEGAGGVVPAAVAVADPQLGEISAGNGGMYVSGRSPQYRRRSTGSYSLGDLHSWFVYMVASVVGIVCAATLANEALFSWAAEREVPEEIGFICIFIILFELLILVQSIVEMFVLRLRLGYEFGRRDALTLLETTLFSRIRRVRDVLSIVLSGAVLFTVSTKFQLVEERWVVMLAVIVAVACSSVVSVLRRGDSLYLGGAVVMLISPFLPLYSSDGVESTGILHFILGSGMVLGWIFLIERVWLTMLATGGVFVFLVALTNGEVIGATFGASGACVALLAAIIGCGEQIQDGISYTRSIFFTLLRSFIGSRSRRNMVAPTIE